MGYGPRTYGYRFDWRGFLPPGLKVIVLACTGVFIVETLLHLLGGEAVYRGFIERFGLVPFAVTHGLRVWQPFTYLFLHEGLWHLLINMLVLWMFGADLERTWGTRRFYNYFFITGVGAAIINIVIKTAMDPTGAPHGPATIPTIGASGAIYGVLLAAAMVFPHRQVMLFPFPVTLPMRVYVMIMGAVEFFSTLGSTGDNVSHISHLGGMLVGYLFLRRGSYLYTVRNQVTDWKRRRLQRRFEVYKQRHRDEPPSPPDQWVN
jgi:membrane associated rhomboid family serine protease